MYHLLVFKEIYKFYKVKNYELFVCLLYFYLSIYLYVLIQKFVSLTRLPNQFIDFEETYELFENVLIFLFVYLFNYVSFHLCEFNSYLSASVLDL